MCDKVVCERWCVRWCVTSCVWKMICDKVVCERWCVTKLCAKEDVWDDVWQMMCDSGDNVVYDKVVCERWCVTKLCVWKKMCEMMCDKVVCERWCVFVDKVTEAGGGGGEVGKNPGYRIKNKNPTQRCGEKCSKPPTSIYKWIKQKLGLTLFYNFFPWLPLPDLSHPATDRA